jgi:hypothetical protein
MIWLLDHLPTPPVSKYLFLSLAVFFPVEITDLRGVKGRGRSQIIGQEKAWPSLTDIIQN